VTVAPIRILLADDHTVLRDGLRALLEARAGLQVVGQAGDGREAVRLAAKLQPEVALLDISMPLLNGLDAAERIAAVAPATRVIILSVHATSEHVARALRAGARGYLVKEVAGIEVVEAIQSVHAGGRYLSRSLSAAMVDEQLRERPALSPLEVLSPREREVLQLLAEGRTGAEIASALHLSLSTVDTYRSRLMQKLGLRDLPALIKFAIKHGLTGVD
jgi:DNA-binding NarL/FixJ family response regulator